MGSPGNFLASGREMADAMRVGYMADATAGLAYADLIHGDTQ